MEKNDVITKKIKLIKIIYISFIVRSLIFEILKFNPKIELNQHLEKPIKPKQFAIKKVMKHDTGEKSKNDENM